MPLKFNGEKMKEKREEAGFTSLNSLAGEFYRQFDFHIYPTTLLGWEQGKHIPGGLQLVMLARILGVKESLFFEEVALSHA